MPVTRALAAQLGLPLQAVSTRIVSRYRLPPVSGFFLFLVCTPSGGATQMITLKVNGQDHQLDVDPATPLLWVLRDTIGLTGTKYGCGIAACGACTVHMDGQPTRSCSVTVGDV